jgi:hypothetical protein
MRTFPGINTAVKTILIEKDSYELDERRENPGTRVGETWVAADPGGAASWVLEVNPSFLKVCSM